MGLSKKDIQNYVDTAASLGEAIKKDIQKGGPVSKNTVLALNDFMIASNLVKDLLIEINKDKITYN